MGKMDLDICLGEAEILVGGLQYEAEANREYSCFRYAPSWLESPEAFALAPALSLNEQRMFFSGDQPFPPALMDTLPDSWGRKVLKRAARMAGADQVFNTCFFLLSVADFCRMGALRIRPTDGGEFLAAGPSETMPRLLNLAEFGKTVQGLEKPGTEYEFLRSFVASGSSLGGARPKCSVLDDDHNLAVAKFTSSQDAKPVERMEVTTLRLARLCGLSAPEAGLMEGAAGLPIAVIKRFDRRGRIRYPYISAQTFLDSQTAEDRAYTELADQIRIHGFEPKNDLKELFKRILFTILVSNVDDHLRNHGFLYAGLNKWSLAPIFDVNPSPDKVRKLKNRIAEGTDNSASLEILLDHAFYFELKQDEAVQMAASMAGVVKGNWERLALALGLNKAEIKEYKPAFEHTEMALAEKLGRRKARS